MDCIVQYLIINREILALGPGVLAAQATHASVAGYLIATGIGLAPLPKAVAATVVGRLALLK